MPVVIGARLAASLSGSFVAVPKRVPVRVTYREQAHHGGEAEFDDPSAIPHNAYPKALPIGRGSSR